MRTILIAVATAALAVAISSTAGFAFSGRTSTTPKLRFLTIRPGDLLSIPSIDLQCNLYFDRDAYKAEVLGCSRRSVRGFSRGVIFSRYKIQVGDEDGVHVAAVYTRAP